MLNDQDFFAPIGDSEDTLINRRQNFETYVGPSALFGNKILPEIRRRKNPKSNKSEEKFHFFE